MELIQSVVSFILHIDKHLAEIISMYGTLTYVILFGIIFVETGFVITPFLPGDSLLFAAGAFAGLGALNIWILVAILILAAILGDTINYWIGHVFGDKILKNPKIPINPEHIEKTETFFDKHGGKTIILARFVPIVRTFAPFVAGIGSMHYGKFLSFNIVGGVAWVLMFLFAGYFFGNIPAVQHNFTIVIMIIILISVAPMLYHAIKSRMSQIQEIDSKRVDKLRKKKVTKRPVKKK